MASVIWDVGLDIKSSYIHLFKLAEKLKETGQMDIAKNIEDEAKNLKSAYLNLAKDHGWV